MRVLKAATIDVWRFFEWRKGFSCAWVSINSQTHCTASLQSTWATSAGVEQYNYIHQHSKLDSLLCESNCSLASPSKSSNDANVTVLFSECAVSASWAQIIAWRNRPAREMSIIEYTILLMDTVKIMKWTFFVCVWLDEASWLHFFAHHVWYGTLVCNQVLKTNHDTCKEDQLF